MIPQGPDPSAPEPKRHAVVYSDDYIVDIGAHVFPVAKYALIVDRLIEEGAIDRAEILAPPPATREELLLVHTPEYLDDLLSTRWTPRTIRSELPLTAELVAASILTAGGTTLAAREAVARRGFGLHIGGGFHHAFAGHAEGFCYINDIAVAIRTLQHEGAVGRAAVVDCDVHQGNGTARIFQDDPTVFTFSIHQQYNYPMKEQSTIDIGLDDGATDEEYLEALATVLPRLDVFRPELILYVAGADPFREDYLGGLGLTKEGLARRDEMILQYCGDRALPVAAVLAGGYAQDTNDTVEIHVTTCRKVIETARRAGAVREQR